MERVFLEKLKKQRSNLDFDLPQGNVQAMNDILPLYYGPE